MVLIYSHTISPRLQYTCSFIFEELMGAKFIITTDAEKFKNFDGVKINYSYNEIQHSTFNIQNHGLLFETGIKKQTTDCFETGGYKAFFKIKDSAFAFDIFAATFYLLSRYEEYLPHEKDMYGRFAHNQSIAFKEGFLNLPLINIWVKDFIARLQHEFPTFNIQHLTFKIVPTYDIDIAYSYKAKGLMRNIGGFLQSPSLKRINVLLGLKNDPFDTYQWLDDLNKQYNLQPIYFFLLAQENGVYDKNILPHTNAMQQLTMQHSKKYSIGIHPSWQSGDNDLLLHKEIKLLEEMGGKKITRSRQHYIRFNLPQGYRRLIDAGITDEYSMGYGSINGFRASVASSFYWYDLGKEEQTSLRIHPFCYMEANSFYEQKLSTGETCDEIKHYYTICKKVNGSFISIWHNHMLGSDPLYKGWRELYQQMLQQI